MTAHEQTEVTILPTGANDNHPSRLLDYKKTAAGGTGALKRISGVITLVGCVVDDQPGNAHVDGVTDSIVFTRTASPISVLEGRIVHLSESDIAATFARKYGDELRFDHTAGAWFEWVGSHWQRCETGEALYLAGELAHAASEGARPKEAISTRRKSFAAGVEAFARVDPALATLATNWDADSFLLGTPGGTVDLRTGLLRPANPGDMISKVTATTPADTADCPRWLKFLDEASGRDPELVAFMQRWAGYCLTGTVKEHALVFVFGPGGNGKSVFVNLLVYVTGGYATTAAMDTFTESKGDRHPTDMARLAGARLVTASETDEGRAWDEAKIKSLTGGDRIAARFMRQDFFEFDPRFKLLIVGNYLPALRNVTDATRRRFNIVPFTIRPTVVDKDLETKLKVEAPGILRWAIDGCLEWQRMGLGQPPAVREATDEYFGEQDVFGKWLEECCRVERDNQALFASTAELFRSWHDYAHAARERPGTETAFGRRLTSAGFEKKRLLKRGFVGIQLLRPNRQGEED